jgi:hypothetical protein
MYSMHFILGAHHTMINKLGNKWMYPLNRFLQDQRQRNPQVVQHDVEQLSAVECMDRRLETPQ